MGNFLTPLEFAFFVQKMIRSEDELAIFRLNFWSGIFSLEFFLFCVVFASIFMNFKNCISCSEFYIPHSLSSFFFFWVGELELGLERERHRQKERLFWNKSQKKKKKSEERKIKIGCLKKRRVSFNIWSWSSKNLCVLCLCCVCDARFII